MDSCTHDLFVWGCGGEILFSYGNLLNYVQENNDWIIGFLFIYYQTQFD